MYTNPNLIPLDSKEYIERLSELGVFEEEITDWIRGYKKGTLTKEDVLKVTQKVAQRRGDSSLVDEIKARMGL